MYVGILITYTLITSIILVSLILILALTQNSTQTTATFIFHLKE